MFNRNNNSNNKKNKNVSSKHWYPSPIIALRAISILVYPSFLVNITL